MLIEFTVGNFRSIREKNGLSMVASGLTARNKSLDADNVFRVREELSLLKTAAIYGPNAGGKTNFVRALRFMRELVLTSSSQTQINEPIAVEPFLLHEDTAEAPSFFEIVFELGGVQYRYGFTLDRRHVHSEWLYYSGSSRERTLFERDFQSIKLGASFRKEGKGLDERTRPNALFLSVVAQWNGAVATQLLGWFQRLHIISGIPDHTASKETLDQLSSEGPDRAALVRLVKSLDLGIEDIRIDSKDNAGPEPEPEDIKLRMERVVSKIQQKYRPLSSVRVLHRRHSERGETVAPVELDLERHESDGTQKLFALAGLILGVLRRGEVCVGDEFDMRLHPLMTRELVRLFHSKDTNPHNAQLIFTTHDTNLLAIDLFRRDQIWFAEKDRLGATHLYSLAEFKVRNDASFEKDYIRGKFGAIPFLGGLRTVVDEVIDEASDG